MSRSDVKPIASVKGQYEPPFTVDQEIKDSPLPTSTEAWQPPSICSTDDDSGIPGSPVLYAQSISEFLNQQLSVKRLNDIHQHLWWAGRPNNIRPLHRQRMMHREIAITEDPSLHLVWYDSTIYIKPLPSYLLHWQFFKDNVCADAELYKYATGFLLTYAFLVRSQSDFKIALETGLIPEGITWPEWSSLAATLLGTPRRDVNERYIYGELRLRRLNHVAVLFLRRLSYYSVHTQYDHFFSKNFAWLVLVFAYISVILTAMQVVLQVADMGDPVERVSYWFGVATIVIVLAGVVTALLLFVCLFLYFLFSTLKENRRVWMAMRKEMPQKQVP